VRIPHWKVTEFVRETRSDGIFSKLDGGWGASSLCWARWIQEKRAFVFPILELQKLPETYQALEREFNARAAPALEQFKRELLECGKA